MMGFHTSRLGSAHIYLVVLDDVLLVEDLDGETPPRRLLLGQLHIGIRSLPQEVKKLKVCRGLLEGLRGRRDLH